MPPPKSISHFLLQTTLLLITFNILSTNAIPGCPSLTQPEPEYHDQLSNQDYSELDAETDFTTIPLCFCDRLLAADGGLTGDVNVACLFGATTDHMRAAIRAVNQSRLLIRMISLNHIDFVTDDGLRLDSDTLASMPLGNELDLRIAGCNADNFTFDEELLAPIVDRVTRLEMSECNVGSIPSGIRALKRLRQLQISMDLTVLNSNDLAGLQLLEELDLGGNYMESIEQNAFLHHPKLNSLWLGPKNVLNNTVFPAVRQASQLERLLLNGARLKDLPDGFLSGLNNLKELYMERNDVVNISAATFTGLPNLQFLDLRLNLIRNIDPFAFDQLPNLDTLHLLGNYIEDIDEDHFGPGLSKLKFLDLAFNEIITLRKNSFKNLIGLVRLDLQASRNYPQIDYIESGAYNGLSQLKVLNMSATNVTELPSDVFFPLLNLEEIDLAQTALKSLPKGLFKQNQKLAELYLDDTDLETIDVSILEDIPDLKLIDLSYNNWLCDDEIAKVIDLLNQWNIDKALQNRPFYWRNSGPTTYCNRPYTLNGKAFADLDTESLVPYNGDSDTTPSTPPTLPPTTTTGYVWNYDPESGNIEDENSDSSNATGTIIFAVIGLCVAVMIAYVVIRFYLRKRKGAQVADVNEMHHQGNNVPNGNAPPVANGAVHAAPNKEKPPQYGDIEMATTDIDNHSGIQGGNHVEKRAQNGGVHENGQKEPHHEDVAQHDKNDVDVEKNSNGSAVMAQADVHNNKESDHADIKLESD